jgi:GntR family transcriptional repressor for pyruvate dehydrogenase complex
MATRVGAIEVPKSCDVLARRLREQILAGAFPAGEPLPTERELVAETGLSRGSVREALRILEAEGLLHTRPGRYGGSVVSRPSETLLARQVDSFARGRGVGVRTLIEAREALEPTLAQLAARHRTERDLAELDAIHARMRASVATDVPAFLQENVAWHWALAVASGNELLRAFMASIAGMIHEASRIEHVADEDVRRLVLHAHARIVEAIRAGDGEAARRRMDRHVKAYSQHIEATDARDAAPPATARGEVRRRPPRGIPPKVASG